MFVHNHLMAGPSTRHALQVMLFRTHSLRILFAFTGWRNRYGPASIPWLALPPSKGRSRSPVTLAIKVQSSRVNGLAWASPQASGAPVPASSLSVPSTIAVIRASLSVGEPGLSAREADAPPAEPGDRVGGPNATWYWVVKATMVTCPSCRRFASRVTNCRRRSTAKLRNNAACSSFVSTSDSFAWWGCRWQRAQLGWPPAPYQPLVSRQRWFPQTRRRWKAWLVRLSPAPLTSHHVTRFIAVCRTSTRAETLRLSSLVWRS